MAYGSYYVCQLEILVRLLHSDIRLMMNTYTQLDLADTAGAVAALPVI